MKKFFAAPAANDTPVFSTSISTDGFGDRHCAQLDNSDARQRGSGSGYNAKK